MIETIICGKVSGNFIVESLFKLKDIIEISGILKLILRQQLEMHILIICHFLQI